MPVRSLIEFNVRRGAEKVFEAIYLEYGFLDRAKNMPGFLSGEFLRTGPETSTFWATA
jgi:heme-degrading monooxygenase HmoA